MLASCYGDIYNSYHYRQLSTSLRKLPASQTAFFVTLCLLCFVCFTMTFPSSSHFCLNSPILHQIPHILPRLLVSFLSSHSHYLPPTLTPLATLPTSLSHFLPAPLPPCLLPDALFVHPCVRSEGALTLYRQSGKQKGIKVTTEDAVSLF